MYEHIHTIKTNIMKTRLLSISILFISSCLYAQGNPAREEVHLNEVYEQFDLSGEGTVVVMLDRGIDYRHPDFIDENGNTRLAYIFDMIDQTGATDPENIYGVGTIFSEGQINEALLNNDPPLSTDRGGHGTATTAIIAGDGSGTASQEFQGVAPKAKIISIKVTHDPFPAFGDQPGQDSFFNPNFLPIAMQFAQDKIEELGLPSVTLMNLGSIGGPTDGTSLICQSIDAFVEAGHPFVCGVGDDGGDDNHASGSINQDQTIEIEVIKGEAGNLRFDLWYSENDRFAVRIERPNGIIEGPFAAPTNANGVADQNLGDIFIGHRGANTEFFGATSERRELLIDFSGAIGTYKVILEGTQIDDGGFNATLNPAAFFNENRFGNFVTPGFSINDYASANLVITPGDYVVQNNWIDIDGVPRQIVNQGDPGELWVGSSSSPTQDGRLGIDFAAPGEVCYAAYADNTYYESFSFNVLQNSNGLYGIQNAVSASAPLSTGVIALMLEVNPDLTPEQIRTILQETSRQDSFTGTVPNDSWGYGKLDALAAILATQETLNLEESTLPTISIYPNPSSGEFSIRTKTQFSETTVIITNVMGQIIASHQFNNESTMNLSIEGSPGLYFVTVHNSSGTSTTLKVIKK